MIKNFKAQKIITYAIVFSILAFGCAKDQSALDGAAAKDVDIAASTTDAKNKAEAESAQDANLVGRKCFFLKSVDEEPQPIIEVAESDHEHFPEKKCNHYFSYYQGKVFFKNKSGNPELVTKENCIEHSDLINLRKGYAPFGVFFRGAEKSKGRDKISAYSWTLYGPMANKDDAVTPDDIVKQFDSFNAAHVFETPGFYKVDYEVTTASGEKLKTTTDVEVWKRDKSTYYVDSETGDDRYNGKSKTPRSGCDVRKDAIGSCEGPWKTATRALGEVDPTNVESYPNGKYTFEKACKTRASAEVSKYSAGNFKIYRSSAFLEDKVLKDANDNPQGPYTVEVCDEYLAKRDSVFVPGDQILFKRGQVFELEMGDYTLKKYNAKADGVDFNYERLECKTLTRYNHWSKAIGLNFSTYGAGDKPLIQNTGKASCKGIQFQGVGIFNMSFVDLKFNLESAAATGFNNRAVFFAAVGNPLNTVFLRTEMEAFDQGILFSGPSHGVFIVGTKSYDSQVVHIYFGNGFDIALIDNHFEYAGNHLGYTAMINGLVQNNTFTKPAFGRTALRIKGSHVSNPDRYVWISNNKFLGWVDPRTGSRQYANGKRYNYTLVHLGPNKPNADLAAHDFVFKNNLVTDSETLLSIGNMENLEVSHNVFRNHNNKRNYSITFGTLFDNRPLKNIVLAHNIFTELGAEDKSKYAAALFRLQNYNHTKCVEQFNHQGITITHNTIYEAMNLKLFQYSLAQGPGLDGNGLSPLTLTEGEQKLAEIFTFADNEIYAKSPEVSKFLIGGQKSSSVFKEPVAWSNNQFTHDGNDSNEHPGRIYRKEGTEGLGILEADNRWNLSSEIDIESEMNTRMDSW